jgi:hypothetical protein
VKLSMRAMEILMAIRDACYRHQHEGKLGYWSPGYLGQSRDRIEELNRNVNIEGAGDLSSLKSLQRKGLIARPRGVDRDAKYLFVITEDGLLAIERARESGHDVFNTKLSYQPCPKCHNQPGEWGTPSCEKCNGSGLVESYGPV